MTIKIVIGTKSGKCFQKELSQEESESLYGKVLGEEFNSEIIGITGAKFLITVGSDASGFPMRKDLNGINKKKLLITKSTGFKGKLRGKRFGGLRIKRTVAGNTVYEKTHQLNIKVTKGDKVIIDAFKPAVEPAKEEAAAPAE